MILFHQVINVNGLCLNCGFFNGSNRVLTATVFGENVHELAQETLIRGVKHIDVLIGGIADYKLKNLP